MSVWRLAFKEIRHRKVSFALGLLSVAIAVASLVGAFAFLRVHDLNTEEMMRVMEDDYRTIMKKLGFNVLILPKGQTGEFWAKDFASRYMPEEYADRLAESRIMVVRHLLPSLQQKIKWPERRRTIILIGVRGEVPLLHRRPREPMVEPVPAGGMVLGHELHQSLDLAVGDTVKLLGREFTVTKLHPERGTKDDITAWINLAEAQELLDKKGKINGIVALQCFCAGAEVDQMRAEIARILPDTEVIEFATKVLVRAEARATAAVARAQLRREREDLAALIVPLVILACAVWVGLLSLGNVRERRPEIGVLRTLGLRSRQIFVLFLARAMVTGLIGAAVGYSAGLAAAVVLGKTPVDSGGARALFDPILLVLVLVLAPVLSAVASWIPALVASGQDPAIVLREE